MPPGPQNGLSNSASGTGTWRINTFNSSPPRQNGRHFADDVFKYIFMNEKLYILFQIALKFILQGPIDNKWALVQVVAWRLFADTYMRH